MRAAICHEGCQLVANDSLPICTHPMITANVQRMCSQQWFDCEMRKLISGKIGQFVTFLSHVLTCKNDANETKFIGLLQFSSTEHAQIAILIFFF